MRIRWGVLFSVVLMLCMGGLANAQTQITAGTIQGVVTDEKGGTVGGANIEVRNLDTNFSKTQSTDSDGRFTFLLLPPGRYTVTVKKEGFSTVVQESINLTVGQALSLPVSLKVGAITTTLTVTATPTVEVTKTESSSTLNSLTVANTPILGRKFEDLLTLTPGVSIVQGPDGDEISFNGQRGIFNNISLDGGDYNNGFFGEQAGGQRAAIDISLEAVKEFQVVASGASAEFGRTAGGVVNVITKSGTNDLHGSIFHYQRLRGLAANTSDGKPLTGFHREQSGGAIGGPLVTDKMFLFGSAEVINENLQRANLSAPLGSACSVTNPVAGVNDAVINASAECQRVALLNFIKSSRNQDEGLPIEHRVRNFAALARWDWNFTQRHQFSASYNFDYSRNPNQTFDVPTYGNSANGIEGGSKINVLNSNFVSTLSATRLNEAHFTYQRESRPRFAVSSTVPADTAMGFATTFRFGAPFFLEPKVDELIWRTQIRDNFSIISGKHNIKLGGEWLYTDNSQVFRGFFTGRYIFDSVVGFLRYASPAAAGGFGPRTGECLNASGALVAWVTMPTACPAGSSVGGPLIFYLQDGIPTGVVNVPPGASDIKNHDLALFIQDKWQVTSSFTLNYGLRWEAQIFPSLVLDPSKTAYGSNLSNPAFPSDGTLHSQKKEFQPRVGFSWDVRNNHKSVLRASWGIYNGRQNMLTQVGSITTNGAQQFTLFTTSGIIGAGGSVPTWPNALPPPPTPGTIPAGAGVRVFSKDYANPRIYATNVGYEHELLPNLSVYADFSMNKGVHLTRFNEFDNSANPSATCPAGSALIPPGVCQPNNGDAVTYPGPVPFPNLSSVFVTGSSARSLYRGVTFGLRKKFSNRFQLEGNYTYSRDLDDDSNERDPFTDRTFNRFDYTHDYANADRDQRHRFNFYTYLDLPAGFLANIRMQAHSAQPITDVFTATPSGPPCSATNSNTRVVNGVDCGRNHLRKDNAFFTFDWRLERPFHIGERIQIVPVAEMFNTFNNKNNVNPLVTPGLFNFDGFLRQGVGDPLQLQLAVKLSW